MNVKITSAWQEAATDLGIRVIEPYATKDSSGTCVQCEAFLPDFGSPSGAVALSYDDTDTLRRSLEGQWCSTLFGSYEAYDRQHFIETLEDWGWFGPSGEEPNWFSGKRCPDLSARGV